MKKILIVEDDTQIQATYKNKLKLENFDVISAYTGKQAMALIHSDTPDIILLDIMLPGGMNGFDVMEQMARHPEYSKIPVIVLTNLETEEKVAKTIGAKDYLVKADTSLNEVVEVIKKYADQHQ